MTIIIKINEIFLAENVPKFEPRTYDYFNVKPAWIPAESRPKHYQLLTRSDLSGRSKMRNSGKRSIRLRHFLKYHLDN